MSILNIFTLMGGLAMFIFGMNLMSDGLKQVAGSYLKNILAKLTANRMIAMLVGAGLTALIQSSNAMCVMVVGFVNAGLMELERSIGILMGAKIGTTITGQLIAFKITTVAPVIAFVGVAITMFAKSQKPRAVGQVIASLGILFIGLDNMSNAMEPLGQTPWFRNLLAGFSNPILCILIGIIFTMIVQSASASVGVLQIMVLNHVIGFEQGFFVMMGMNIGAGIAPAIASLGGRKDAKRVAFIVILFESIGMLIFLILSQVTPILPWIESTSSNLSRQIANANTLFNIVTVIVLLPFAKYLAKIAQFVIPGEDEHKENVLQFINEAGYSDASILVEQVEAEVHRMVESVRQNLSIATDTYRTRTMADMEDFSEREEMIDFLNKGITDTLVHMNSMEMSRSEAKRAANLFHVVSDLERIGDQSEELVSYANRMIEEREQFSTAAQQELENLLQMIYELYDKACKHLFNPKQSRYNDIYTLKRNVSSIIEDMKSQHIVRLNDMVCNSTQGLYFIETLSNLEHVAGHSLSIARGSKVRYHHTVETDTV